MPSYDYYCEANQQTVEVRHGMNEKLATWGEVCEKSGLEPGRTALKTPVQRLISGGAVVSSSALHNPDAPACAAGGCCAGGACGLE